MYLSEELYHLICTKSDTDFEEHFLSHQELEKRLEEYFELYGYSFSKDAKYGEFELIIALYSMAFGLKSLSLSWDVSNVYPISFICALQCLLTSISNTALSVCSLLKRGMYHEGTVLSRNLDEQCLTLLSILIDEKKRNAYISNNGLVLKRGIWRKNFSFPSLNSTLNEYERSMARKELDFLSGRRVKTYAQNSSSVHNGFANLVCDIFIPEDAEDPDAEMIINLGGMPNEQIIQSELHVLGDSLFYTTLVLRRLIHSKEGTIDPICIVDKDSFKMWDQSQAVGYFAELLLLYVKEKTGDSVSITETEE